MNLTPGRQSVLVLSHGFGCGKSVLDNTIALVRRDVRFKESGVLSYDLAFSGQGGKEYYNANRHRYETLDGYVEDLIVSLQHYGISQCVFVGHSTSGFVGILASIRRGDLFSHLILIRTSPW